MFAYECCQIRIRLNSIISIIIFSNPAFTSLQAESPLIFLSLHRPAWSHNTTNFPHVNHMFLQIDIKNQTNQPD